MDFKDEQELSEGGTFGFRQVPLRPSAENLLTFEVYDRSGTLVATAGRPVSQNQNLSLEDLKQLVAEMLKLETDRVFSGHPKLSLEDLDSAIKARIPEEESKYFYLIAPIEYVEYRSDEDLKVKRTEVYVVGRHKLDLMRVVEPHTPPKHLEIPKELGNYKIIKVLGQGAFTVVCLAEDVTSWLGRKVALKIPIRQRLEEKWIRRVLHEAKVWRILSESGHPNILNFEDLKRIGPFMFFVTEYMDGGNLDSALDNADSRRIPVVIHALEQICEGLAFAHRRGVVHGDIKPQNILVSKDLKRVKLGDFGLSFLSERVGADDAEEPKIVGTLMFLAPESFDGKKTPQTDIYALGVTLFYLLTGEYPFNSDHYLTLIRDLRAKQIERLKAERMAFRPNLRAKWPIPAWFEEVVQRCMAPRPEERFSDATELLEHIVPFINPSKGRRIVLTVWCNPESQTVDYDLEVKGQRSRELLTVEVTHDIIKGLCDHWDKMGSLALERAARRVNSFTTENVDEDIRELLLAVSEDGAHFMFGPKVRKMLAEQKSAGLWLLHEPRLAAIPWELLNVDIDGSYLCRRFPMARWPKLLREGSPHTKLGVDEKIRVLLIADPCGDLPGTKAECERLKEEFNNRKNCPIAERLDVEIVDESVDSFTLRSKMRRCHIIHYAGHGVFSERRGDLSKSGWLLKGDIEEPESGDILRASALDGFWTEDAPILVFANGCWSGRASLEALRQRVYSDAAMGLAQAFLSAGVGNYIGHVWDPPDDETPAEFASVFYREFFAGRTVSQAILTARNYCAEKFGEEDLTWARYVLFGDPFTHIQVR